MLKLTISSLAIKAGRESRRLTNLEFSYFLASAHEKIKAVCRHPVSITRLGTLGPGECLQSCRLVLAGVLIFWKELPPKGID